MPIVKLKPANAPREEIVIARQMHQALVLHFLEGLTQAQIADQLGISHATVNRLIKRGRQLGLVEIKIKSPVEPLVDMEEQLRALGGIGRAVVVPTVSDNPQTALQAVGEAAARLLLEEITDGDTICITGGKGVSAVVAGLQAQRRFDVEVIPATGCVQGKHYTDVNHVSTMMADRLGGRSYQIHAPLFADSAAERGMLINMRSVADVFKRAREAKIAVVGIGSILSDDSSYYDLHPSSSTDRAAIERSGASCELLAHLLDDHGQVCDYSLNRSLVSLTLPEFASIPTKIGVASGPNKAGPILSVLRGNHLDTLVTDEATGARVLALANGRRKMGMSGQQLTREIGKSGVSASAVGLGTWAIGGWMWGGTDENESIAAIQASLDAGVTLIDTAPAYGLGRSEEIVGKALAGRRDKAVIATKCGLVWHTQKGRHFFDQDGKPVHRYLGRDAILHEVEDSLKRLGTDHIDLYITHWQDPTTPVEETMRALEDLRTSGKIRAIGASNVSREELDAYIAIGGLDAIQERFSMIDREIEQDLLPQTTANGIATLSYSSLALGLLSGTIGADRVFSGDDQRKDNPRFSVGNRQKATVLADAIRPVAEKHEASIAQTVIAWTLAQPGVTFALCGARNPAQAIDNARAGTIRLEAADLAAIDTAITAKLTDMDR